MAQNTQHPLKQSAQSLTLPAILLLAALLRFYQISAQSLWSDEGNSAALIRRGFIEIAQRTAFDIHPPFYYWLLKIWTAIFGPGEVALRSLSAVLGVGVVYLVWRLGKRLFNEQVGLIAAFIAALSPLQVYYSQEARMYMLLTFLGCLTVLLGLLFIDYPQNPWLNIVYILTVTAGLYTHYAYPVILIALNLAIFPHLLKNSQLTRQPQVARNSQLIRWLILQLIPFLLYFPWLSTAWRQLTTWPSEQISISLREALIEIPNTLLFGLSWPFDTGLLPVIILGLVLVAIPALIYVLRNTPTAIRRPVFSLLLLYLWFLLPVCLTLIIFSPAFLKFLLVATPPLAILLGLLTNLITRAPRPAPPIPHLIGGVLLFSLIVTSAISLHNYYTNPIYARDNYRGIVSFIKAVGGPDDAIILHAEGQQDVFNYYFRQNPSIPLPVYPLPRRRPLNESATLAELQNIAHTASNIYSVYWATQQADPAGLIENWLNTHLYKATDQWYGNVRLVSYASPQTNLGDNFTPVDYQLGDHIHLTGYALVSPQAVPGDILQLALQWETTETLSDNYTVFAQVLSEANHLVGQRDAPPLTPGPDWPVNEPVADAHGIFIEPGTPPGQYQLIVGLYNSATGQRLPVGELGNNTVELAKLDIIRPSKPLPREAFNIQVPLDAALGNITLAGYDLYKVGYRSTPETSLHPGDPVHLVLYWYPNQPLAETPNQIKAQVVTNNGTPTPLSLVIPRAETGTIEGWSKQEIVRAQADFFLSELKPGQYRLAFNLDDETEPVLSLPFYVE